MSMPRPRRLPLQLRHQTLLLILGSLALLLLFTRFDRAAGDLNTDESFTAIYTRTPNLGAVLEDVRKNEETPPLYFILIWGWARLFGTSETALRLFSSLFGVLLVAVFGLFARRRLAPRTAIIATVALVLFNPLTTYMLVARAYVLLLLLSIVCVALFEELYHQPDRGWLFVAYGLAAAALLMTHYFGSMLLLAHQFLWYGRVRQEQERRWQRIRRWALVQLATGAALALWLPQLIYQVRIAGDVTVDQSAGWVTYLLLVFSIPINLFRAPLQLGVLLSLGVWMLIGLGLWRGRSGYGGLLWRVFIVPTALLVPLLLITQAFALRYLILLIPGAAISLALGSAALDQAAPRIGRAASGVVLGIMLIPHLLGLAAPPAGNPWPPLLAHVAATADPAGDCVVMHAPWDVRLFRYYYTGPELCVLGAYNYDDFYVTEGHSMQDSWTAAEAIAATQGRRRIWVFNNYTYTMQRLTLPYPLLEERQEGKIKLSLYAVPAAP